MAYALTMRSCGVADLAGPQARAMCMRGIRENQLVGLPGALYSPTLGSAEDPALLMSQYRLRWKPEIAFDHKPLGSEQDYLAFHAAAVVAYRAVGLDHAVTRHKDRNRI